MTIKRLAQKVMCSFCVGVAFLAAMNFTLGVPMVRMALADQATKTPIQHVIVIIGENRTFDHIFATYASTQGESVSNLLSKGIINADGTPGPNFALAHQNSACDVGAGGVCPKTGKTSTGQTYGINPEDKALYDVLPTPLAGGPTDVCTNNSNLLTL